MGFYIWPIPSPNPRWQYYDSRSTNGRMWRLLGELVAPDCFVNGVQDAFSPDNLYPALNSTFLCLCALLG